MTHEMPVTGWATEYLRGAEIPTVDQWPPDALPTVPMIAIELGVAERTARKYLQLLDSIGFLRALDERRGGSL